MAFKIGILEHELLSKLTSFELTEEEEGLTVLNEDDVKVGVEECRSSCIAKIFSTRETHLKFIRVAMKKAWKDDNLRVI